MQSSSENLSYGTGPRSHRKSVAEWGSEPDIPKSQVNTLPTECSFLTLSLNLVFIMVLEYSQWYFLSCSLYNLRLLGYFFDHHCKLSSWLHWIETILLLPSTFRRLKSPNWHGRAFRTGQTEVTCCLLVLTEGNPNWVAFQGDWDLIERALWSRLRSHSEDGNPLQ